MSTLLRIFKFNNPQPDFIKISLFTVKNDPFWVRTVSLRARGQNKCLKKSRLSYNIYFSRLKLTRDSSNIPLNIFINKKVLPFTMEQDAVGGVFKLSIILKSLFNMSSIWGRNVVGGNFFCQVLDNFFSVEPVAVGEDNLFWARCARGKTWPKVADCRLLIAWITVYI